MARAGDGLGTVSWTIIGSAERRRWLDILERFAPGDIYYHPDYHRAYEGTGTRACAFLAEIGGETLFHPILVRQIDTVGDRPAPAGLSDAESVYGYTGPLATSDDPAFLAVAWRGYDEWCRETGVVCEFVRFNPLLDNYRLAAPGSDVRHDRQTVIVALDRGMEAVWRGYKDVHRNSVRKARKNGLVCTETAIADGLAAFTALYRDTMRTLDAEAFYRFTDAYFDTLARKLGESCRLFLVHHQGQAVAGALFLTHGTTMHYHLAGASARHREMAPNNLLIDEAARWGAAHGYRLLHLGGGRTPAADDGLFRFKARFSRQRRDLYLGRRVFDRAAFDDLNSDWRDQYSGEHEPPYFQLYRLDPARAEVRAA